MRKRPAALACLALGGGAAGLALAAFGPASTGCTTHQCDESFYEWPLQQTLPDGGVMAGGFMQDENTYVSNDLDSPWLVFRGNTTVKLWFPPEVAGRHAKLPVVAVGTDDTPNSLESQEAGANFTDGVGQLAIFNDLNTRLTIADAGGECAAEGGADGSLDGGFDVQPCLLWRQRRGHELVVRLVLHVGQGRLRAWRCGGRRELLDRLRQLDGGCRAGDRRGRRCGGRFGDGPSRRSERRGRGNCQLGLTPAVYLSVRAAGVYVLSSRKQSGMQVL